MEKEGGGMRRRRRDQSPMCFSCVWDVKRAGDPGGLWAEEDEEGL